jgi:hypothetical protein
MHARPPMAALDHRWRLRNGRRIRCPSSSSAHVATFGERVVDVFYVTALLGAKITAATRQAAINGVFRCSWGNWVRVELWRTMKFDSDPNSANPVAPCPPRLR